MNVQSLPIDVFEIIFEQFVGDSTNLVRFALVHPFWTALALEQLFSHHPDQGQVGMLARQTTRRLLQKTVNIILLELSWL